MQQIDKPLENRARRGRKCEVGTAAQIRGSNTETQGHWDAERGKLKERAGDH